MKELCEKLAEQYAEDKSKAYYIDQNGDQKWYMTERGRYSKEDFLAGYQAAKDQVADADKVMNFSNNLNGWISVEERLPEGGKVVLVAMPKGTVTLGGIQKKTQTFNVFLDMAIWTVQPTYWMPLPDVPKHDKE